jgi:8-oxo-dGTP pyrophosphatase MutT (NUDIX family)
MSKRYSQPGFIIDSDSPLHSEDITFSPLKSAAVLIPLLYTQQQWHVLFIRRAERLGDHHSGQVAFPGGKVETQDKSLQQTAIRETHEEIGINANDIEVLAQLSPYHTISNFKVHPFVGLIPWPTHLDPQTSEVAKIFTIPLRWLMDCNNYSLKESPKANRFASVHYKHYEGELLWGATARMTLTLLQALDKGDILIDNL